MADQNGRNPTTQLYDVVAIRYDTRARRTLAERKTLEDADAVIKMAVIRRGVEEEFYKAVPIHE
jgi:hypothetical protein